MEKSTRPVQVHVQGVSFGYFHHLPVLQDVNFEIREGDYVGIVGPNGGGKSTLIKLLINVLRPQQGSVHLQKDLRIGYVPQRVSGGQMLFPATVKEVVSSGRTSLVGFFGRWKKEDDQAVHDAMETVRITGIQDRLIGDLSGGQRQRVFIARALARRPHLIILDEPTVGVDIEAEKRFFRFLDEINKKKKTTIILISHDIDAVAQQVDYVLCLNKRLVCNIPGKDLVREDVLKKMYGENVKFIVHQH
ncbi:metal ABC transporter ATP-binding protein [Candidatus Gracilibacteria bacterium]|nr:metal ABC transporter ATP-binding protein [Candidatus Gracilibacteria bacterium]